MAKSRKVIVLTLADHYWAEFSDSMCRILQERGYQPILVSESRLGEYQVFYRRNEPRGVKTYYLSDFCNDYKGSAVGSGPDRLLIHSDFMRLRTLAGMNVAGSAAWDKAALAIEDFVSHIIDVEGDVLSVVHEAVSTSLSYKFLLECRARDIPYIGFLGSKINGRYECFLPFDTAGEQVRSEYDELQRNSSLVKEEELEWAEEFLSRIFSHQPDYMKGNLLNNYDLRAVLNLKNLKYFFGSFLYWLKEREDAKGMLFQEGPVRVKFRSLSRNIVRRLRALLYRDIFDRLESTWFKRNSFYVFPLHYQPEASTLFGARYHLNQLELIKNLAFALEPGVQLVVKEHLSNYGYLNGSEYSEISNLPGVSLIGPENNIKEIVRQSLGVITLTSTVGFEAVLMDIPVVVFGDVFYDRHPLCAKTDSVAKLQSLFEELRRIRDSVSYDNRLFLMAYKKFTRAGIVKYSESGLNMVAPIMALLAEMEDR
jgi:hypothetical protein